MKIQLHNGMTIQYYDNGKKLKGFIIDNEWDGSLTEWYENGKVKFKGSFKNFKKRACLKNGLKMGKLKAKRVFLNGALDGKCIEWNDQGQKIKRRTLF